MQRKVVGVLRRDDMRDEAWPRDALRHDAPRHRRRYDVSSAAVAGVLLALVGDDEEALGLILELFGDFLADRRHGRVIANRASLFGLVDIVNHLAALEIGRQGAASARALSAHVLGHDDDLFIIGGFFGDRGLRGFDRREELELIGIQFLGLVAALQPRDERFEKLNLLRGPAKLIDGDLFLGAFLLELLDERRFA